MSNNIALQEAACFHCNAERCRRHCIAAGVSAALIAWPKVFPEGDWHDMWHVYLPNVIHASHGRKSWPMLRLPVS